MKQSQLIQNQCSAQHYCPQLQKSDFPAQIYRFVCRLSINIRADTQSIAMTTTDSPTKKKQPKRQEIK